ADQNVVACSLLNAIVSLDHPTLTRVERALYRPQLLSSFEVWDLHQFIANPRWRKPRLTPDENIRPFLSGREPDDLDVQVRAAASIYLPSRTSGRLIEAREQERGSFLLMMDNGTDETVTADLPAVGSFWSMLYSMSEIYRPLVSKHMDNALRLEAAVRREI